MRPRSQELAYGHVTKAHGPINNEIGSSRKFYGTLSAFVRVFADLFDIPTVAFRYERHYLSLLASSKYNLFMGLEISCSPHFNFTQRTLPSLLGMICKIRPRRHLCLGIFFS